jgi:hypothetical protein
MVEPQRKTKVWDETAKLWLSVAQKAIEDAKYVTLGLSDFRVDYICGTYGFDDKEVRDVLHKKGGKVMDVVKLLGNF